MAAKKTDRKAATARKQFSAEEIARIKGAEAIRPVPGEAITGTIVTVVKRESAEYADYPCVILDIDGEYRAFHAFHEVAQNELREAKARPGMEVVIMYHGKRQHNSEVDPDTGEPKQYHGYTVVPAAGMELEEWSFDSTTLEATEVPY